MEDTEETKTLYQIHHQFLSEKRTEMLEQKEIGDIVDMKNWQVEIEKKHPLPEGAVWLVCREDSKYFITTEV